MQGLDTLDWPESTKKVQINWIGKSEGSEVTFRGDNFEFNVFTTRVDTINGVTYVGAQNIYFAQLSDSSIAHISPAVTQYFGGEFAAMIFGLPAGAYAIYRHTAKKFKKSTGSVLQSASLTSALVGITEPIEFLILPVAPFLFVFHALMCGLCNAVQYSLNFAVGCTFSSGLLDLIFLGILPGAERTSWPWIIPIGIVMAIVYYV